MCPIIASITTSDMPIHIPSKYHHFILGIQLTKWNASFQKHSFSPSGLPERGAYTEKTFSNRSPKTIFNTRILSLCLSDTWVHNKNFQIQNKHTHTHTHTHPCNSPFPGLPRWAGTRKVRQIWILLKQETVSGSGISWAICKSAPLSRQKTTPAPHHSVFYRPDALPATQPTASKHSKHKDTKQTSYINQRCYNLLLHTRIHLSNGL